MKRKKTRKTALNSPEVKSQSRLLLLPKVTIVLFIILSGRLWYLQIIQGQKYVTLSQKNSIKLVRLQAPRGQVMDRNGEVLIGNRPCFNILVFRSKEREEGDWDELFSALGEKKKFSDLPVGQFFPVKKDATREEIAWVEERKADLPEVSIELQAKRHYAHGQIASHVLGYVGEITDVELQDLKKSGYRAGDIVGKSGVEKSFEEHLRGKDGGKQVIVDARGYQVDVFGYKEPVAGNNLSLTIDFRIQETIEEAIGSKRGSIIVMDPRNGEILGIVSRPSFDPNIFTRRISAAEWKKLDDKKAAFFRNRGTQGEYPPGSTFKLIVAVAALEEGVIGTDDEFGCEGAYQVGNRKFRCWKTRGHGRFNITEGIVHSCDIFFYQLGQHVGVETIALYAHKLGLGGPTEIDLPGERSGLIPIPEWKRKKYGVGWYPGDTVNMSIGQGFVLTTPIQMVNAYCAIANGGTLYRPHLLKGDAPEIIRELNLKPLTKKVLQEAFTSVVSRGTGYRAQVSGVEVAGKTGTSENPHGADHASFIGFAPAGSPSVCVSVMLENAGHGSSQAAPLCGKIIKKIMQLKK